jgi:hypothetical protein
VALSVGCTGCLLIKIAESVPAFLHVWVFVERQYCCRLSNDLLLCATMSLKPIGIKLEEADLKKLKQIAADEERSVGFLIRRAVKLYLANPKRGK